MDSFPSIGGIGDVFDSLGFGDMFSGASPKNSMSSMKSIDKSKFVESCLSLKLNLMKELFFSVRHLSRFSSQGRRERRFDINE